MLRSGKRFSLVGDHQGFERQTDALKRALTTLRYIYDGHRTPTSNTDTYEEYKASVIMRNAFPGLGGGSNLFDNIHDLTSKHSKKWRENMAKLCWAEHIRVPHDYRKRHQLDSFLNDLIILGMLLGQEFDIQAEDDSWFALELREVSRKLMRNL